MLRTSRHLRRQSFHYARYRSSDARVEDIYQKKTPLEHVLLRPGMYIGSIEKARDQMWLYDDSASSTGCKMTKQSVEYVPALYKIFDEILVNAIDNKTRDKSMNLVQVTIDPVTNAISIYNNGRGIPIKFHKDEKVYVPELVLGHLLTGSNFDDSGARLTGGRHGYGAKLTNIFSTEFTVETGDKKLYYKQEWRDNMRIRQDPEITGKTLDDHFTRISFSPDLKKFGMTRLDDGGMMKVLEKRVYDVAGCLSDVRVELNGSVIPFSGFQSYMNAFRFNDLPGFYTKVNRRWEVGVLPSDDGFAQISYVNGMATLRGGTHVNYITDQLTRRIADHVNKKFASADYKVTPAQVRPHLNVFINCWIENPTFDSQMKEFMSSHPSTYGSSCILSEKFSKQVIGDSPIVQKIVDWIESKQKIALLTKGKGRKKSSVNVPKLEDANKAGTATGNCTLILTEGDSAKALAVAGLEVVGRDHYGVFPLRGKLLNVRDATLKQLSENAELSHLCTILGLDFQETYETEKARKGLRYSRVMLMTDQDLDGSHIKGLVLNLFHHFWPNLLRHDFLSEFITPLIKVGKRKSDQLAFYSLPEYHEWRNTIQDSIDKYQIKYYKGLGTNTAAEGKEYFRNLTKHAVEFKWTDESDGEALEMAFSKHQAAKRKNWLQTMYDPDQYIDVTSGEITYRDFVNKELIQFSFADNERSLPSAIDGLKPSQRKVLYACFKRNLTKEIKVAQLAGYCSENTGYHHGEASLHSTIINMAQNYVGSNNIPLLYPSGQFGTRLQGGKDAASPRYIFTKLGPLTRLIFPQADEPLLTYKEDDGMSVEPLFYVPIVPLVLVNGSEGIGTGWSSSIPTYNPIQVIENVLRLIHQEEPVEMIPYAVGFEGQVLVKETGEGFITRGNLSILSETKFEITELPVGKWVEDYKTFLQKKVSTRLIKSFTEHHTDRKVRFVVTVPKTFRLKSKDEAVLAKEFKLDSLIHTSNMHAFDCENRLKKYTDARELLKDFYHVRYEYYVKRKAWLEDYHRKEAIKIQNRMKFIQDVASDQIQLTSKEYSREKLEQELKDRGFADASEFSEAKGYDYLLNMSLASFTMEKVNALRQEAARKSHEYDYICATSVETMWESELEKLKAAILKSILK